MNRSIIPFAALSAVLLGLMLPANAIAAGLRSEEAATRAGLEIVQTAARGDVEAALQRSQSLGRPDDALLSASLARSRESIAGFAKNDKGSAQAQLPEVEQFGGCIHRDYELRSDSRTQFWHLKFRRTADGWYLDDLAIRS